MDTQRLLADIADAICAGDQQRVTTLGKEALDAGMAPLDIITSGIRGLDEIGKRFQRLEAFLPELAQAGDAMKALKNVLAPILAGQQVDQMVCGKIVLGTVWRDIHDIGKNFVGSLLAVHGLEVVDLGVDVPVKAFGQKAEEVGADIIGLSTLLSTSAYYQQDVIRHLVDSGLRHKYYVIVGGGPVTAEWAREIGADGFGRTARDAVEVCRRLMAHESSPPLERPIVIE